VTILYARLKQVMEQVGESFELVLGGPMAPTTATCKLMGEIGRGR